MDFSIYTRQQNQKTNVTARKRLMKRPFGLRVSGEREREKVERKDGGRARRWKSWWVRTTCDLKEASLIFSFSLVRGKKNIDIESRRGKFFIENVKAVYMEKLHKMIRKNPGAISRLNYLHLESLQKFNLCL